ncbi:MAG TPA: PepSY-like domain-containing protein [Ferruginibacter sp.]|nr:PepSY-like domain-containing protein [Ferruginibacter sp.]
MKKIIAICLVCLSIITVNAQKLNVADVPVIIKNAFIKMYPGIKTAQWNKEGKLYEASFADGSYKGSVLFDENGKWTERETAIPATALPLKIKTYMQATYKNIPLIGAAKITKATGELQYEVEIKGKELFFTKDGEFIKEVK